MEDAAEERLWEIVDKAEINLLTTLEKGGTPRTRPMTLLAYDEDGMLWFATSRASRKVEEIEADDRVSVFLLDLEGGAHAQFFGQARLDSDQETKAEFWIPEWSEHWDGPDDEDYVLVRVNCERAEYYLVDEDELWVVEF